MLKHSEHVNIFTQGIALEYQDKHFAYFSKNVLQVLIKSVSVRHFYWVPIPYAFVEKHY